MKFLVFAAAALAATTTGIARVAARVLRGFVGLA